MNDGSDPNPYGDAPTDAVLRRPDPRDAGSPRATDGVDVGQPPAVRPPFRIVAVVVGTAVDVGGTMVLTFTAMLVLAFQVGPAALIDLMNQLPMQLAMLFLGFSFSLLGGLVCGMLARGRELTHGAVQAVVLLGLGALMKLGSAGQDQPLEQPLWLTVIGYLLVFPAVLLGAKLAALRRQRRAP